jgi:hypothetical protein
LGFSAIWSWTSTLIIHDLRLFIFWFCFFSILSEKKLGNNSLYIFLFLFSLIGIAPDLQP